MASSSWRWLSTPNVSMKYIPAIWTEQEKAIFRTELENMQSTEEVGAELWMKIAKKLPGKSAADVARQYMFVSETLNMLFEQGLLGFPPPAVLVGGPAAQRIQDLRRAAAAAAGGGGGGEGGEEDEGSPPKRSLENTRDVGSGETSRSSPKSQRGGGRRRRKDGW